MNKQKILFILVITLVFLTLLISQNVSKEKITGNIEKIFYNQNTIKIVLANYEEDIILFSSKVLNLNEEDNITIYYTKEKYRNKEQLVVSKIIKK